MPEQLPVPLALPRPKNLLQRRNLDDFEPYSSLSDFQNLMIQTWNQQKHIVIRSYLFSRIVFKSLLFSLRFQI